MNGPNKFYVYEHWRPDKGVCFYVGKGHGKRAWDMKNMRNLHHRAVTSKLTAMGYAVDVRIVMKDMEEESSLDLEIERIAYYGMDNLTNMTGGGDGLKNPSQETRKKISESQKRRYKENPEERKKMSLARKGRKASDETRAKLSASSKGRKHTPEVCARISAARKEAGIPTHVREAQRKAVTGRTRAPFSEETKEKMRLAALRREADKRLKQEA